VTVLRIPGRGEQGFAGTPARPHSPPVLNETNAPILWAPDETGVVSRPVAVGHRPAALRKLLVSVDTVAVLIGWTAAAWSTGANRRGLAEAALAIAFVTPVTLLFLMAQRLYLARVCTLRSVEAERLGRVAILSALTAGVSRELLAFPFSNSWLIVGASLSFTLLYLFRSAYRGWVRANRRDGKLHRPVVVIGTNGEGRQLCHLLDEHPELGFNVVGTIGDPPEIGLHPEIPYLGTIVDAAAVIADLGVTGAVMATTAMTSDELNWLTRTLLAAGVHLHISSGLSGISHSRLRSQPLAHEPLFYVEPLKLASWQLVLKRALDVILGSIALVLATPLLLLAAIAIKLDSKGPVFFRQQRVGRNGRHFSMVKLRTMVVDAESRYSELAATMAGRGGPLVKLREDPRITTVGRFLRATSIDELPQLLNVVMGSMSLVGPRPNLLVEAAGLDPAFLAQKGKVRPGITGLWQVEARDNPSFDVYRRLDLFYLENWSTGLDLAILLATFHSVVSRALRFVSRRRVTAAGAPALLLE
jgi:exopolysaccharide biosynthesis polyprenyl glycosylphosphotransferase